MIPRRTAPTLRDGIISFDICRSRTRWLFYFSEIFRSLVIQIILCSRSKTRDLLGLSSPSPRLPPVSHRWVSLARGWAAWPGPTAAVSHRHRSLHAAKESSKSSCQSRWPRNRKKRSSRRRPRPRRPFAGEARSRLLHLPHRSPLAAEEVAATLLSLALPAESTDLFRWLNPRPIWLQAKAHLLRSATHPPSAMVSGLHKMGVRSRGTLRRDNDPARSFHRGPVLRSRHTPPVCHKPSTSVFPTFQMALQAPFLFPLHSAYGLDPALAARTRIKGLNGMRALRSLVVG